MSMGMLLLCVYIGCTVVYLSSEDELGVEIVLTGAAVGGVGAGILWTAQGLYFAQSAEDYSANSNMPLAMATSRFAGIFGFIFLGFEMVLRILSTLILYWDPNFSWTTIFQCYTLIAFLGAVLLRLLAHNYPTSYKKGDENFFHQVTAAVYLLMEDGKAKYLICLNVAFGFCGSFINSYVNGEVIEQALGDSNSHFVGTLSAWLSFVAAVTSLMFSFWWPSYKATFTVIGGLMVCLTVLPFLMDPDPRSYTFERLFMIYTFWGVGRASSESTLKAVYADFFLNAKEAAFANIVLQNGLASSIGYVASFNMLCDEEESSSNSYCIRFSDGTLHNVLTLASVTFGFGVLGILTFLIGNSMHLAEQAMHQQTTKRLRLMC